MKVKSETIAFLLLALYVLSAPFAYIPDIQRVLPSVPFTFLLHLAILFFVIIFYTFYSRIILPEESKIVLMVFLFPAFISSVLLSFNLLGDLSFYTDAIVVVRECGTRMVNLIVNLSIFIFLIGYSFSMSNRVGERLIRFYYALLFIIVLGGIWQYLNFSFGVPFLELSVKSHFHGVGDEIKRHFGSRLTSFLAEPSYLVAFVIDFILLTFLLVKKRWVLCVLISAALFVLVASYSLSGMANAFTLIIIATALALFPSNLRSKKGIFRATFLVSILVVTIAIVAVGVDVLAPYYDRVENRLSKGNDQRVDIIGHAVNTWFASGPIIQLFGFGPGTFALFKYQAEPMAGTSNNLYVDVLLENGLVGLFAIVFFFVYLFMNGLKRIRMDVRCFVGMMLLAHLAISSMYRADFVSPRFWVVMFIVIYLFKFKRFQPEIQINLAPLCKSTKFSVERDVNA